MVTYRIYTEDINRDRVKRFIEKSFQSYTLFTGEGVFNGASENSLVIEIIASCTPGNEDAIKEIAQRIKFSNQQQVVLITKTNTQVFEI